MIRNLTLIEKCEGCGKCFECCPWNGIHINFDDDKGDLPFCSQECRQKWLNDHTVIQEKG